MGVGRKLAHSGDSPLPIAVVVGSRVGSNDVPLDPDPDVFDTVAKLLKKETEEVGCSGYTFSQLLPASQEEAQVRAI